MNVPLCLICLSPMPNWRGAIPTEIALCQRCFKRGLPQEEKTSRKEIISLIDHKLLDLIPARNDRIKQIAGLALHFSIQEADGQGLFTNSADTLKRAARLLYPQESYNYNLLQSTKNLLLRQGLWLTVGPQKRGRQGQHNQMRLGEKVQQISEKLDLSSV